MYEVLLGIFLFVALLLIGIILIQQGKGADVGASFGAGASNTVFGSSGSGSFLTRMTTGLVIVFFAIALALNYMVSHRDKSQDNVDDVFSSSEAATEVPAAAAVSEPTGDVPAAEIPVVTAPQVDVPNTDVPAVEAPAEQATEQPAKSEEDKPTP
ncbi:preprotein translocase subunit SecG [Permianibacter aggregans]|uniref:Protein-export membrane protein SecG n=1 Tax=Permianibacter aggregans TaxID=1510150 RepID=A0A4R6UBB9_9GAMM|nr:preprotein translocase subunit SecG [Permianibacter aggregans]TDQ43861.1 protein translocase subunit secG [Permianibacter aggregans]